MLIHAYPETWVVDSTKTYSLAAAQASCENAKTQKRKNAHKDSAAFLQHGESQFVIINVMPAVIGSPTAEV